MNTVTFRPKWWCGRALRDFRTRTFFVPGGLGAGKTDGFVTWHHDRVCWNQAAEFSWFFEPTHSLTRAVAVPKYRKHLERMGYKYGKHFSIVRSPVHILTYHATGHQVWFHSFDRPELIVGAEISHATLDEAGEAEVEAFQNIGFRIRDIRGRFLQLMVGGAPQGLNWFADKADSEKGTGWDTSRFRDHYHAENNYRRFVLWTDDNVDNLPASYISDMMVSIGHNENLVQSYRFGRFCPLTEGVAVKNYRPQVHDIDDVEADPFRPIILKFDFNANPLAWVASQKVTVDEYGVRESFYAAIHEEDQGAGQLDDACINFRVKFPPAKYCDTEILLYGDRTGHAGSHKTKKTDFQAIRAYLTELGYRRIEIRATDQVIEETESIDAVNKAFSRGRYFVCRRCKNLKRSLMATTWKPNERKLFKPQKDTWTHWLDAVKYWMYQERYEIFGDGIIILGKN